MIASGQETAAWERYAWVAGIVFVLAILGDIAVAIGIPINQNSSPAKMAAELDAHSTSLLVIAGICIVAAVAFPVYLWKLYGALRGDLDRSHALVVLVLVGGVLLIAFHTMSDVAITGLVGAKLAAYSAQHDPGLSYTLYLLTFAISSVGDIFGSLFLAAAGLLSLRSRLLPGWLARIALVAAVFLFAQGFGLGGVIATFGLVFDLIGFVLFLVFVFSSSLIMLRSQSAVPSVAGGVE